MYSILIYLSVFFIASFFLSNGRKKQSEINFLSLVGICILVIFAGGRYQVGTDYNTYINMFERYSVQPWTQVLQNKEILFCSIVKICYSFGGRVLTFSIFAGMIVIPIYLTLYRYYPKLYGFISFYCFISLYYAFSFNITRQFIAVSFIIFGMEFIFKNKLLLFLTVILIATGFHLSAPVGGLMWLLWDHKKNEPISGKKQIILLFIIIVAIFGYQKIISYITSSFLVLKDYVSYAETSNRGQNRDFWLHLVELGILLLFKRRIGKKNKRIEMMYSLLIISTLIGITGFRHPQVKRLAYYYAIPANLIIFGYLPSCFKKSSKKIIIALIYVYTTMYFILTAYILRGADLIPYQFDLFS